MDDPWLKRPYDADRDEDALHYLLGVSYARSRAGWRAGAYAHARGRDPRATPTEDDRAREKAFFDATRFVWSWLLDNADVTLVVDPEAQHLIWAWLITSGEDIIHAIGCKRSVIEAGGSLSVDIVRDLLGPRLKGFQVCTLELPQMRAQRPGKKLVNDWIGMDRPKTWSLDPLWLLTRMPMARAA